MNATDATAAVFGTLISLLLFAGLYVWTALALSAVLRKSGVEAWKAWVPILNVIVLLQLAGFSPWLVILAFIPLVNLVFLVIFAIALYRVNVAFGFGAGMTVLGFLLFPVWASVLGWGSARWVGPDAAARGPVGGGVRRTSAEAPAIPPRPPLPAPAPAAPAATSQPPAPPAYAPFEPSLPAPAAHVAPPAPAPAHSSPEVPAARSETPAAPPAAGWTPPSLPGRPVSAAAPVEADGAAVAGEEAWQGFALDGLDLSAEVTGAVSGAPAPVSAVPAAPFGAVAPAPAVAAPAPAASARPAPESFTAPEAATTGEEGITRPPVTRVPAAAAPSEDREPWAPARSPMSEADAFPEASGPVSAIVGAPDAGAPRSARSSVSASHGKPEIPDDEDALDDTIIARRKRTGWTLVPPTGDPVALSAAVVIVGRRPVDDPDHPGAQLVSIQDGTVSKTHALLELRDDRWYVTDLDSTNGVLFATVMGTEVEAPPGEEVEAGDRFLLGDAEVRLRRSDG